jgi:hypothetical protein
MNDLERPIGLTPIEAVIEVVKSDCPEEWARYCDLAVQLAQRKQPTISPEEAARQLLAAHSKLFDQKLAVGRLSMPPIELEKMLAETEELQGLFRDRLVLAHRKGRYSLNAFDHLKPVTVDAALIKPRHFRLDSDEMEVNDIKLVGVRFVRAEAVTASQADPTGRKPGQNSPKGLACDIVLSILNDEARRPPKRHGRKIALARMVHSVLEKDGKTHAVLTIEKYIRDTIKDWEKMNPDD